MELLIEAILTSLFIIGLYNATEYELDFVGAPTEKNVLWFVRFYVKKWMGERWGKPIILCPQCMASFWGVIFYFGVFHHSVDGVIWLVVFVPIVSALNCLIYNTITR